MPRAIQPISWTNREIQNPTEQRSALWDWIVRHTGDPPLVGFAARLIDAYDVDARDEAGLAEAVQRFAQEEIKFFREAPERWQSPMRTLEWGIGDCDDKSILIATILRSFRIPVRLKFVRFRHGGRRISHVYPQAYLPIDRRRPGLRDWVALESVMSRPMGFDPEDYLRENGIEPESVEYVGDNVNVRS